VKYVLHVYISTVRIIIIIVILIIITNSSAHCTSKTLCFEKLLFRPYSSSLASDMGSRHLDRLTLFVWITDLAELCAVNLQVK
jgi:hypothetical protein